MQATDLIVAIPKIIPHVDQLRRISYIASDTKLVPELTIEYWTHEKRPLPVLGEFELQSFSTTLHDMANLNFIRALYTKTGQDQKLSDFTNKICKNILFISVSPDEWEDYHAEIPGVVQIGRGQIDTDKVDLRMKKCSSEELSDGWTAKEVVHQVASFMKVKVKILLPDYHIRQYKVTPGKSVLSIAKDLFGFFQPLIHIQNGTLIFEPEPMQSLDNNPEDAYFSIFDDYETLTYTEYKLRDLDDVDVQVVVNGGLGLFDAKKAGVITKPPEEICLSTTAETEGKKTLTIACYKVDEFGRKLLVRTHTYEYDYTIPADAGIYENLIKVEHRNRHYLYDDIAFESPVFHYETVQGQEAILVQDDTGATVRVGQPADITGQRYLAFDDTTKELLYSYETRDTTIWPVTIGDNDNQVAHKNELRKEVYHRSGGKLFAVAQTQSQLSPVLGVAPSSATTSSQNDKVPVTATDYQSDTNIQEAFGDEIRKRAKKRKMQIHAQSGSTDICADSFVIYNPNIILLSEAQEIADFLHSYQSSLTASKAATVVVTLHNDTIYPIGTTFKDARGKQIPGKVVQQELVLNMGEGTIGFDLQNKITVRAKYREKS